MATAKITVPGGILVEVSGTPDEITGVIENLKSKHGSTKTSSKSVSRNKGEIPGLIDALKDEEFFKAPHGLGEIQKKLAELGHHYPITTLSGAMQEQTKRRNLRRFKQAGKYVYVQ